MKIIFAIAAGLLALQPMMWLIKTWFAPAYQSDGFLVAILVGVLLLWSITSSPIKHLAVTKTTLILLGLTALVRLIGQVLDINTIGAFALIIDVYAIGLLLGLDQNKRPISAFWLAVLFAFTLPLEHIMQHTVGYSLQAISAIGACQLLSLGTEPVQCDGIRILLAGKDVLVDLPCSGARGLLLLFILFSMLAAITRPNWFYTGVGIVITLVSAFIINTIRIASLAIGLAYTDSFGGIDVMTEPYHGIIGFTALGIGTIPIIWWAIKAPSSDNLMILKSIPLVKQAHLIAILLIAILIINLPTHPLDIAKKISNPTLPNFIGEFSAIHRDLSRYEQKYFTQYGGGGAKASYGPYNLLMVSTSSPLRHLHTPLECLSAIGHKVRYVTSVYEYLPTAIYYSIDPQGQQWYIRITLIANNGMTTPYISEAVWQWLQNNNMTWTMVQRIIPFDTPKQNVEEWDIAVSKALELPVF